MDAAHRWSGHALTPVHWPAQTRGLARRALRHLRFRPRSAGRRRVSQTLDSRHALLQPATAARAVAGDRGDGVGRGGTVPLRRSDRTATDRPAGALPRLAHRSMKRLRVAEAGTK